MCQPELRQSTSTASSGRATALWREKLDAGYGSASRRGAFVDPTEHIGPGRDSGFPIFLYDLVICFYPSEEAMFISYLEREYLNDGAMRYRQRIPGLIRWINLMNLQTA